MHVLVRDISAFKPRKLVQHSTLLIAQSADHLRGLSGIL